MSREKKYRKKKKLGNYPFLSVIFSMTLALFVLGLFALLLSTTNSLTQVIRKNVEMQVYLNSGLSEPEIARVNKSLSSREFVLKTEQGPAINFISKETAAEEFIEETGEDFLKFLGDNPLKDAYVIKINPDFHSNEAMEEIKNEIEKMNGVFEVVYTNNMIQSINENITKISLVLLGVAIILFLVIGILINNTIKLALFSQRFLIRSMQLVGATKVFIRKPFIYRSIMHGFIAGTLSSVALYALLVYGNTKIDGLTSLQNREILLAIFISLIIIGIFIAVFSTWRAMQKYLAMSLDELY
ncbi:ABC transporter permease [Marivirga sp. S37H4]|uniref:Cell division protein FtsX n=1 Tax=Marivirga aurantiaca TaxID=2802615 RepID=A0A934WXV5_9BACT|nr:permease-like cell division protein FtsX [Marivirga aurantiaca]MBK6264800.1 ABC transporter permease [Marivirga aurantiaca]